MPFIKFVNAQWICTHSLKPILKQGNVTINRTVNSIIITIHYRVSFVITDVIAIIWENNGEY